MGPWALHGLHLRGPQLTRRIARGGAGGEFDLVCRKLGLEPGMRLLDVGCGWGGMVLHAVKNYGMTAIGATLSKQQAQWAQQTIADAGLTGRAEVRFSDYRDVPEGNFDAGFEVRHLENFREHYAKTLAFWSRNLEDHWDDAVDEAGLSLSRTWRLYLAASRLGFELNTIQLHQTLGVRLHEGDRSDMPLRYTFERTPQRV